jgi:hypothetical protein
MVAARISAAKISRMQEAAGKQVQRAITFMMLVSV